MQPAPTPRTPRDWLIDPQTFGARRDSHWRPEPEGTDSSAAQARASRRAAALQHEVALAARGRLLQNGYKDITALAGEGVGLSYSQLNKILNGAAQMTLAHVASLEERLGPLLEVKLSDPRS